MNHYFSNFGPYRDAPARSSSPESQSHASDMHTDNSRSPSPEPDEYMRSPSPPSYNAYTDGLPVMNAGRTLSGPGASIDEVEKARQLGFQSYNGNNDCGPRSLAAQMGVRPGDLFLAAHRGDEAAAQAHWDRIEENRIDSNHYRALASAAGCPVTGEGSTTFLRLPRPGEAATVVEDGHATVMLRSRSGNHAIRADFQTGETQSAEINRVPDEQATRVNQHIFQHAPYPRTQPVSRSSSRASHRSRR